MLTITKTRALYESYVNDPQRAGGRGRHAFVTQVRHWLGLCDKHGNNHRDPAGNRRIREAKMQPNEFDIGELAASLIGAAYKDYFDPSNPGSMAGLARHRLLVEGAHPGDERALLEATGVGVDVSAFANINAWTGVVGGLIERKILEAFESPEFIADELMPAEPTKVKEGQKVIGVSRIGDKAEERQPGEPHRRAGVGERFVTLQGTRENALAIDVFKEAVFFDLTGQLLEHAAQVGEWLAYRKEIDCIDAFIGVTTQSGGRYQFTYRNAVYNTYSTSAQAQANNNNIPIGYMNQQPNELIDWTNLESSWLLFVRTTDPETQTRVRVMPDTLLVNPGKLATAELIVGATNLERRTAVGATQATAGVLQVGQGAGNPAGRFGTKKILYSPLVEQRCTDATGLNLNQANATKYWWHFQRGKAFKYMQNWPLNVAQAPSNSYDMLDRGIVASYFANERGMPSVWSPWHVVLNTN
jgi:hypothetical protein